ncbi:MAG: hypothetical protein HOG89_03080 [Candidatus Peribacter sp.]|jgi:hypothetical protein|nr:hypothetical protein [Candidatus Peribacter sp.]MBT4392658.1 hypothetical protein [Candidatus Peribacter sp.]MBT4600725.1 hypothetical protein [Candidatus Peribacter sp.]MBT5148606.1 hypothetical protein [Candidatus Peribacter sp.]MBT5637798.1 hypothetical protein [Candidatus Peribacter sp.]
MQRHPFATHRLMTALLVGIVAVPMTSTALFIRQEIAPVDVSAEELRNSAFEDRSRLRAQRRLYWQVIEHMESGKIDIEKPDINDTETLHKALEAPEEEVVEEVIAEENTLTSRSLNTQDRGLLRRYTRAGFCPESLASFRVPGFYQLCVSLVGSAVKKTPVMGLLNHNAALYRALRPSAPNVGAFKLRMQMMQEAGDRNNRRGTGVMPGRPTTCVMNLDCQMPRYNN